MPPKKAEPVELTPEERALASRVAAGDKGWETITEESMNDFSLAEDPYKLPEEAAEKQAKKEFAFRWVEAKASRIDSIQSLDPPARWWVCNSTNAPFLQKYIDPAHGGIQKMDQILMMKPWRMHEIYQAKKMQMAQNKDGDINKRDGQKEEYGTWFAGAEHRVNSKDVVMADMADYEGE